jgi:hypothetical protein
MPSTVTRAQLNERLASGAAVKRVGQQSISLVDPVELQSLLAGTLAAQLKSAVVEIVESLITELEGRDETAARAALESLSKGAQAELAAAAKTIAARFEATLSKDPLETRKGLKAIAEAISRAATMQEVRFESLSAKVGAPRDDSATMDLLNELLKRISQPPPVVVEAPPARPPTYLFTIVRDHLGRIETVLATPK